MADRDEQVHFAAAADRSDPRYSIDVRVFLATIMLGMAASFGVGVGFGPDALAPVSNNAPVQPHEPRHVYLDPPDLDQITQEEEHQPAGQHLLVDLKNVDADFLNSEERLANAIVDVIKEGGLTLLSYHCHALIPSGVSCVGVLLESHISLQTWPEEGVITLDLFTCGSAPLLPVIPKLIQLFGVGENVQSQWSHSLRGFRDGERHILDNQSDLAVWVLSPLEMYKKENVVSYKSPIQQIDIWDVVDLEATPTHQDAIRHNLQPGDPRWLTPELVTPDRLLFLDGTLQVRFMRDYAHH
jgi:S-adenosylmethionine decarboxylase proenzyme